MCDECWWRRVLDGEAWAVVLSRQKPHARSRFQRTWRTTRVARNCLWRSFWRSWRKRISFAQVVFAPLGCECVCCVRDVCVDVLVLCRSVLVCCCVGVCCGLC
jgi:hypothetical protein